MELLVLGLVATVGFASYALWSKARQSEEEASVPAAGLLDAPDRTLGTLQPGDVVQHLGTDWLVDGVLTFAEDGRGARLYRLADGAAQRFLFTAPGDADPLLLAARPLPVDGVPESLLVDGYTYVLKARLAAAVLRAGAGFERRTGERVAAVVYTAGAARVFLLHWTDRCDCFIGERVGANLLELLPGH
jgi:Domain of unknown function (DUF4178)